MPLVVKEDESLSPVSVALLGFRTVMPRPDRLPDLIEQLRLIRRSRPLNADSGNQPAVDYCERVVLRSRCMCVINHDDLPRYPT